MITAEQLNRYLKNVPPLPETLRKTLEALDQGDLAGSAKEAEKDRALVFYLKGVVNSAAFGFKSELNDVPQIFSALGIQRARQLLYAYMVASMAPETWGYFDLDTEHFRDFQVTMMRQWERIIKAENAPESYLAASALLGAGLVVADAVFAERAKDVALLQSMEDLTLDTILERISGVDFAKLVGMIAKKWEVSAEVAEVVLLAFGKRACDKEATSCRLAKLLHLLLFYALSRPAMMRAGVNGFVTFNPAFSEDVTARFQEIVEIA